MPEDDNHAISPPTAAGKPMREGVEWLALAGSSVRFKTRSQLPALRGDERTVASGGNSVACLLIFPPVDYSGGVA